MRLRFIAFIITSVAVLMSALPRAQMKPWNNAGLTGPPAASSAPAPGRDLSGIWDAGQGGIQPTGYNVAPLFTALGEKMASANKPGNGPRIASVSLFRPNRRCLGRVSLPCDRPAPDALGRSRREGAGRPADDQTADA